MTVLPGRLSLPMDSILNEEFSATMNRRDFLKQTGLLMGSLALGKLASAAMPSSGASAPAQGGASKPDVLFIAIEDVSPQRFHTWGNPICQTPNFDRLASQGLRFDLAHCMAAPCNPSRTSLLLGLRPETHGVFGNFTDWHPRVPGRVTMVEHFKNNGYETIRMGKMFHAEFEDPKSWTEVIDQGEKVQSGKQRKELLGPGAEMKKTGAPGVPFVYGPSGLEDEEEPDGYNATQCIKQIEKKRDKPAFITLGFHRPHLPFTCPDKYFAMYDPNKIPLPVLNEKEKNMKPGGDADMRDDFSMTDQQKREAIAAEYACITFVDAQVGRVLDALEKSGKADNTIVVVWSDHGFLLGEHRCWRKGALYDKGVMVALMMKAPGVTKAGSVCKRPVESIDIFPTLYDLCGLPMPDQAMECVSMRTILQNPEAQWKFGARTMSGNKSHRSLRTEKFRYTIYPDGKTELFDYAKDPDELTNVADDPEYKSVVAELKPKLDGDWKGLLPAGFALPEQCKRTPKVVNAPPSEKELQKLKQLQATNKENGGSDGEPSSNATSKPARRRGKTSPRAAASTQEVGSEE